LDRADHRIIPDPRRTVDCRNGHGVHFGAHRLHVLQVAHAAMQKCRTSLSMKGIAMSKNTSYTRKARIVKVKNKSGNGTQLKVIGAKRVTRKVK
jgi:hypothetical protein